jgi:phage replication O-like protein O
VSHGNPQLENGYIRIAIEIWEAITKYRLPGLERQCLDFILRKTYGWNKKSDIIPLSQFSEATGIKRQNCYRALKSLENKNIIVIKSDYKKRIRYSFNKKYKTWKVSSKVITVIKSDDKVSSKVITKVSSKVINSIDNIKDKDINKKNTKKDFDISICEIYDFYLEIIKPFRKTSHRAKKNIQSLLKNGYNFQTLKDTISNYRITIKNSDPEYRKDPANFFGPRDKYYIDYLPENFKKPPKERWRMQ